LKIILCSERHCKCRSPEDGPGRLFHDLAEVVPSRNQYNNSIQAIAKIFPFIIITLFMVVLVVA
jgi:hypothetical protein